MASERLLRVTNLTRKATLAERARHARSFLARGRGLLGHPPLQPGEGLILEPCNSVHMLGMRYGLDVIFASSEHAVMGVQQLAPWRFSKVFWGARYAIELPLGAAAGTEPGDTLLLEEIA